MKRKETVGNTIVKVEFCKGGEGFIKREELKTKIKIFVKVFHGNRKNHQFEVSILDKIHSIYEKLIEVDGTNIKQYYQLSLMYPMGYLRNLNDYLDDSFLD